jgi:hypothetical protein
MKERILELIKQIGPMLPVEISSKIGVDSFMAKAFLMELVEEGKISQSKEKLAESPMYYLPGQERQVVMKMENIKQQHSKTARTYAPTSVSEDPEVQAKREAFARRLAEIEAAEQKRKSMPAPQPRPLTKIAPSKSTDLRGQENLNNSLDPKNAKRSFGHTEPSSARNPRPVYKPQQLPPPKSTPIPKSVFTSPPQPASMPDFKSEPDPEYKPEAERTFIDKAMDWLKMEGYEIVEEINAKKTEMELLVKVYTDFGKVNFYMKIKQKKTITEADLMAVYAGAMEQKCPAVLLTNGKLSKSAEVFLEEKGWIVKVKQL